MNTTLNHETRQHYLAKGVTHLLRIRDLSDFTTYNVEVTEDELYEDIAKKYKGKPDLEVIETLWFVSKEEYEMTLPQRKKQVSQEKLKNLAILSDSQRETIIDRLSEETLKALLKESFLTIKDSDSTSDFFDEINQLATTDQLSPIKEVVQHRFQTEPLLKNTNEKENSLIRKILDYSLPLLQKVKQYGTIEDWGIRNSQEEFEMITTFGKNLVTLLQQSSFIQHDLTVNPQNVSTNITVLKLIEEVKKTKEHSIFEEFDYSNFGEEALQIIKNRI